MAVAKIWNGSTWVEIPVGITDHGDLTGLTDVADHPATLLRDGTRSITGNQLIDAAIQLLFRDSDIKIYSNADGELTIEADVKVTIGVAGDVILGDGTLRVVYPATDEKEDLGKQTNRFRNLFLSGVAKAEGGMIGKVATASVSDPPTDAEIDAIFGEPATVGAGFFAWINDTTSVDFWFCTSDGTNWQAVEMIKAV